WEASFSRSYFLTFRENDPNSYATNRPRVTDWVMWDFSQRMWGSSFGPQYPVIDEDKLKKHIQGIHNAGDYAAPYMSAWFYYSRNPQEFVSEVKRWKDEYGIDGIYSDGLPGVDWLTAYIEMRMLRQLFPAGPLIIHDSAPQTGNATRRFVHTYATYTLLGEEVQSNDGENWPYPRFVIAQYRKANCLGCIKGNRWDLGGTLAEPLIALVYNGRPHIGVAYTTYSPTYLPILDALHQLWLEKGDDPCFYDRYFLPKAQQLTGYELGRAGMPIHEITGELPGQVTVSLSTWSQNATIHYTTDGSAPTPSSPLYQNPLTFTQPVTIRAATFKNGLERSRIDTISITSSAPPPQNQPPVIESGPLATPDTPAAGENVQLNVQASDPDDDVLSYQWQLLQGPAT
ncbi:MAG: hypothetical protein D6820_17435, partial [Lentisphaerae bacterium]